jgi:RNA polymerase sigma-70 factor (ECF subfamily)
VNEPRETVGREEGRIDEHPAVAESVAAAQAGDSAAFERLYRGHVDRVYGLCLRMVGDVPTAERLTQDAFVRAWEKLGTYRGSGAFGGWLHRLTARLVIEDRRRLARETRRSVWFEEEESMPASATTAPAPVAGTAVAPRPIETAIDLERAIAGLPPGARTVFVLHEIEGYRHREIAALTGAAEGTIKAQLHRARRLLRAALAPSPTETLT